MTRPDLSNTAIADALEELGDLNELDGVPAVRVRTYRIAARSVRETSEPVARLACDGRATKLPGIGPTIEQKVRSLVETGTIPAAERLRAKLPAGIVAMTRLPGIGPKRARLLYDELGIHSLDSLRQAAHAGRLRSVRGLGPKLEEEVLAALPG
jgi:DNA polymerase (family X)